MCLPTVAMSPTHLLGTLTLGTYPLDTNICSIVRVTCDMNEHPFPTLDRGGQ